MRRRSAAHTAAFVTWASALMAAQDPRPPQIFQGGVELVQLDVSVLDQNRQPVRGLTAPDFTVLIDGRPQTVVAFKAVELSPRPPAPTALWIRDVAPDVVTNTRSSGRVIAILIDDASLSEASVDLSGVQKTRQIARSVIEELAPDDRAAVVFTGYGRTAQTFTSDRQLLRTAVANAALFGTNPDPTTNSGFCYCGVCSIDALGRIAESLRSLPEQRKILIYVSAGSVVEIPRRGVDECTQRKRDAMHEALRHVHLANVTIHAIDPKGLVTIPGTGPGRRGAFGEPLPASLLNSPSTLRQEFLRMIAESTGGRAVVNDNDMERHVPVMLAESSSYYLLGVERPASREAGQLHRVEVRVNRRGANVRTRSGYYDPTLREVEAAAEMAASGDPAQAILGGMPKSTIPLDLSVAPFATTGRQAELALALGVTATSPAGAGSTHADEVEVLAQLFNIETGQSVAVRRQQVTATWSRPDASSGYYEVLSRMTAPPGRYELRVGLRGDDGRTSSVYTSVEIPDSRDDLSVSGLMMGVEPPAKSGPPDTFVDLLPMTPTARRVFRPTDRVSAFLRVHQNRRSFARTRLTTRLIDANNKVVAEQVKELDGTASPTGSVASYLAELPTGSLAAGEYLFTIDVEALERTVRRTARFRIE